ncbi:exodeoxyribonuclease V subunit beta [Saccharospirillum alexandrii]|uniref:exodeoxyribonuclease V subunit beta n=1 Tax=Saccharospirillum alexandrii TaxID=2448477 RepID=UPI003736C0D0
MLDQAPKQLKAETLPLQGRQLIEASAGTGKTYNITRLYLRLLLEQQLSVEQILVMTFTKAATAELKGRLGQLIRDAHDHWGAIDEPFFNTLAERIEPQKARALLHKALLNLDEAAVYTIHGFCKRALTQQAFASGISFHAEMEADSSALILEALQDWYRREARGDQFEHLQSYWATPDDFANEWGRTIGGSETVVEPELTEPHDAWNAFCRHWASEADAFYTLNVKPRRGEASTAEWQAKLDELTDLSQQPWPGTVPEVFGGKFLKDAFSTQKKVDALPHLHTLAQQLAGMAKEAKAWWAWQGITFARAHLLTSKDRLDQLDFNDLIIQLRQRLQDADAGPALAAKLAEQFPVALVDEFQDTDPDQYAILDALYPKGQPGLLCMIGDPKQAIYGFRGGDVFAYLKARDNADQQWHMDTNFRSHPAVVQGYNRLFYGEHPLDADGQVRTQKASADVFGFGIDYLPVKAGKPDLPDIDDPADRGAVQWCLLPATEDEPKGYTRTGLEVLADWTAREIRRLLFEAKLDGQPVQPGDIALLVRSKHEAEVIQNALRTHQLASVYLSARDNVLQSAEAETLARALNGILNLENDRALIAALATPWFGYDTERLFQLQQDEHAWAEALFELTELRERWFSQGLMSMALQLFQRHVRPHPQRHERTLTNSLHLLELLQQASQQHRQPWQLLHWFDQARQDDTLANIAQLRLESDANLIQVITQHGAKGLEYPIVFLPFVSYGRSKPKQPPMLIRYHDRANYNAVLALNPSDPERDFYEEEQAAEDIRLLYVAATRAERRLYVMAAEFKELERSPLARCLNAKTFDALTEQLTTFANQGNGAVLSLPDTPLADAAAPEATTTSTAHAAQFHGRIERDWWLSSFSALTRNARHGGLTTPDRDQDDPEQAPTAPQDRPLRFRLARGAEAGNLLHDLLERLDFEHPDFTTELAWAEQRYPALLPKDGTTGDQTSNQEPTTPGISPLRPALATWLSDILNTELPSGARLADLSQAHTQREAAFYFPMASKGQGLARILARHRNTPDVILPEPPRLKGMMHGYIDLIYQWQGRYYVVDYKSTWLGERLGDYNPTALTESVHASFYDLQYLLYTLALHRYLRTRLPDYKPEQHLGGVHYLYLRGMTQGQTTGIYHRDPDLTALHALDTLFTGTETPA